MNCVINCVERGAACSMHVVYHVDCDVEQTNMLVVNLLFNRKHISVHQTNK